MKVLYDATWIGKCQDRNMHGGLRVTDRHIEGLYGILGNQLKLTQTLLDPVTHLRLKKNARAWYGDVDIVGRKYQFTRILKQFDKALPKVNSQDWLRHKVGFVSPQKISEFDVYQSSIEPIPKHISDHNKIKKFIILYDLIPKIYPEQIPKSFHRFTNSILESLKDDTHIMTISASTKDDLLRLKPSLHENQVRVNYIAADKNVFYKEKREEEWENLKSKFGITSEKFLFTLNAMAPYKNLLPTIDAFVELKKQKELKDHSLIVVGKMRDANYRKKIMDKYNDENDLIFIEYVSDDELRCLYNNASCFLYMSLYEGFGLPILEAMQCGCPVICSNTSSMPEVAGDACISISPKDMDCLKDNLLKIVNSESLREELSTKGLDRSEFFSWQKFAQNSVDFYTDVLNDK